MPMTEPSQAYLEKKELLELEKQIVELRHKYKVEELQMQREFTHSDHEERMQEIRLKNRNIQRSIEEKDRRIRMNYEKRKQRFAQKNHGEPAQSQAEEEKDRKGAQEDLSD